MVVAETAVVVYVPPVVVERIFTFVVLDTTADPDENITLAVPETFLPLNTTVATSLSPEIGVSVPLAILTVPGVFVS